MTAHDVRYTRRLMTPQARAALIHVSLPLLVCIVTLCSGCDEENSPPELLPLSELSTPVNQTVELLIYGRDAEEGGLNFSFTLDPLPNVVTEGEIGRPTLTPLSPRQAVFRWAPSVADVGVYGLTISVSDRGGLTDQETIRLEVFGALMSDQSLRFTQPAGAGQSYRPESGCLELTAEVAAAGVPESEVLVTLGDPALIGATLDPLGELTGKRRRVRWCPTADQLQSSDRYTLTLIARRRLSAQSEGGAASEAWSVGVKKRYLIRLESDADPASGCVGRPPTLEHTPPRELSGLDDYRLELMVRDDFGIKSPPLLALWTGGTPPEQTSVTSLADPRWSLSELTPSSESSSESPRGDQDAQRWVALIPNLGLVEGERVPIYYAFLATDNDDPEGTRCDHTTESAIYELTAVGGGGGGGLRLCEPCSLDDQCGGPEDLCIAYPDGDFCGRLCNAQRPCGELEECIELTSPEGMIANQCVPVTLSCEVSCAPDRFDAVDGSSDDDAITPVQLTAGSYPELAICGEPYDLYYIEIPPLSGVEATLSFDGTRRDFDLLMALERESDANGELSFSYESASPTSSTERIRIGCARFDGESEGAWVAVAPYDETDLGPYTLTLDLVTGECSEVCVEDDFEEFEPAQLVDGLYPDLAICDDTVDVFTFEVDAGWAISALIDFELDRGDLNLYLYGVSGELLWRDEATRSGALIEWRAVEGGVYTLEVSGASESVRASYDLDLYLFPTDPCSSTRECGAGLFCYPQLGCVDDECGPNLSCGEAHACVYPVDPTYSSSAPDVGRCASGCESDVNCRALERCKSVGRGVQVCGVDGSTAWGGRCASHDDCEGALICAALSTSTANSLGSGGARCVRAGCDRCQSNEVCVSSTEGPRCLPRCDTGCPSGWSCQASEEVCYPVD